MQNLKDYRDFSISSLNEAMKGETGKPSEVNSFEVNTSLQIGEELFPTGKSNIKTNNTEFKKLVQLCKNLPEGTPLEIIGGASAVGSPGFDNKKLALDRANNLIEALKKAGVQGMLYKAQGVVGKSTIKDSPEALAEQFVKIKRLSKSMTQSASSAIDNTVVKSPLPVILDDRKMEDQNRKLYRIIKVYYPKGKNESWWKQTLEQMQKMTENGVVDVTSKFSKK
jgi:hypothetical protein